MVLNRLREKLLQAGESESKGEVDARIAEQKDCLGCRLIGTGSFSGLSAYALYQRSQIPKTRTLHRFTVGALSAALFSVAIVRAVI